ncbi:flagellar biosynthesis protein FlhF [Algiphilus sp.]|uniref:flagellar biosynthesis protein FlhF n=1 Tax=Algiphilus sp. TaxID=1872431 RepID=UPI0025C6188B|nr:flagellar biosynthesis protein FlhF [Algiphilus sp.]MCK5771052.1 flagellar biosynthesis protein FlhF [Algiphilus sp.]
MKIKRYFASTMREAMRRVREEQGADAVILGTEARDGGIELVAAVDYDESLLQQAARRGGDAESAPATAGDRDTKVRSRPAATQKPASKPSSQHVVWAQDPQLKRLQTELKDLRQMLSNSLTQQADAALRAHPERARALRSLEALGIESDLARDIAAHVPDQVDTRQRRNLPLALLARRLRVAGDDFFDAPSRIALVGPTGAGKTTTLAKLAARAVSAHGAREVSLISMDGHRAGADAQIAVYARLLGVSLRVVRDADELRAALDACADCRHVLIDTAGAGPADHKLAALLPALAAMRDAQPVPLRTLLALPANVQREDLLATVARFAPARPAACVLTKVDEAARLGGALSALIGSRLPLAWLADGQAVPRDLHRATSADVVLRAARHAQAAQISQPLRQPVQERVHA